MIPTNGSSFGRAGGRLRRYPGGTENASIFATVRGSMPNRRAASRRLIPSTYTARRTCPYSSTPFIPPPSAHLGRRPSHAGLLLRPGRSIRPLYEGLSLRRSQNEFPRPRSDWRTDQRNCSEQLRCLRSREQPTFEFPRLFSRLLCLSRQRGIRAEFGESERCIACFGRRQSKSTVVAVLLKNLVRASRDAMGHPAGSRRCCMMVCRLTTPKDPRT